VTDYATGSSPECARYGSELAELALGIATGRERAEALAHVEQCPICQAEMERLSLAADSMLEVIPGIEPPLGFEVRLAERLGTGRGARRHRRAGLSEWRWGQRRLSLVLASLLALVALGAGAGAGWLMRGRSPAVARSSFGTVAGGRVVTQSLMSKGRAVGSVAVYSTGRTQASGQANWLFMSLDVGSWTGQASCEITLFDGHKILLGTFWLDHGYGAWGVGLAPGAANVASALVLGPKGVLASAEFPSSTTRATTIPGYYSGAGGN